MLIMDKCISAHQLALVIDWSPTSLIIRPRGCPPACDGGAAGGPPPGGSNIHLQRAITLYGLPSFIFIVIEFCRSENVLSREQYWLNWLFSLPASLRYNFNPIADRPPFMTPAPRLRRGPLPPKGGGR